MFENIKKLLQEGVDNNKFPGAQYAIVYQNGDIHFDYLGNKQTVPNIEPNSGNEVYDVASLTKVLSTTIMIMKLIEEDKLSLATEASNIIPQFRHKGITIYHLLTHTSGLPADIKRANTLKDENDVFKALFGYDLINEIGAQIVYSDLGFILLGLIITKITGLNLNEYSHKVIFGPLKMKDTSYRPNEERCAPTEERNDEVFKGFLIGKVHDEKAFALDGLAGHAGLFSTAKDIAKFILAVLNDEFVLNSDTLAMLFPLREEGISAKGNKLARSLGYQKPTGKSTAGDYCDFDNTIIHTGFTGCNMFIDKLNGIGFVMLSNAVHPKREQNGIISFRNKISNMIFAERK